MGKNYSIEVIDGVAVVRCLNEVKLEDFIEAIDELNVSHVDMKRIWDLSNCDIKAKSTDIMELAAYTKTQPYLPARLAVIAPKDYEFGISRMYEVFRKNGTLEINVFRTEEEAFTWLKEDKSK